MVHKMAEKRYFWLKLQDDFFTSKRIKKLRKMAGGNTYTIIYLKLQLLALKTEGILSYTGLEDDFADELALDIDEEPDDIRMTLTYLLNCGLAETSDNINFFFPYTIENTGSEGSSAKRMRDARKRAKITELPSQCANDVRTLCEHRYGEIEKEKNIEIEKNIEDINIKSEKPTRHKYGEYNNVLLSDEDMEKLKSEFPNDYLERIERLSGYIASTGKSYKNHLATIRNWARKDKQSEQPKRFIYNDNYEEGDSL